jgi:hypothetical protein
MVVTLSENIRVSTADDAHAIHMHLFMKVFMHKETCADNKYIHPALYHELQNSTGGSVIHLF